MTGDNKNDPDVPEDPGFTHIDDWLESMSIRSFRISDKDRHAVLMLDYFRRPAHWQLTLEPFFRDKKLFTTYKGDRYRVTGASRLGDIFLTKNFDQKDGYEIRVAIDDCSELSDKP